MLVRPYPLYLRPSKRRRVRIAMQTEQPGGPGLDAAARGSAAPAQLRPDGTQAGGGGRPRRRCWPGPAPSCPGLAPSARRVPESGGTGVSLSRLTSRRSLRKKAGAAGSHEAGCAAGERETESPELKLRNITSV